MIFYGLILLAVAVGLSVGCYVFVKQSLAALEEKLNNADEHLAGVILHQRAVTDGKIGDLDNSRRSVEKEIFNELESQKNTSEEFYCEFRKNIEAVFREHQSFEERLLKNADENKELWARLEQKAKEIGDSLAAEQIKKYRSGFENDIQSILSYSPSPKKRSKAKRGN